MEKKTKVIAEEGKQEIIITREFDLPLELLFIAHIEPAIIEQWMGTKVLNLENKRHGSYHFETTDPKGNKHIFHGTIHEFIPNQKIIRTFEMEGAHLDVQLEFIEFEKLTDNTSKVIRHSLFRSVALRDQLLQWPFAEGINMAYNRLEEVAKK